MEQKEAAPKRPGPGRPRSPDSQALLRARVERTQAQANLAALEFSRKRGELISRAVVEQAAATVIANIVQVVRSIPDNLERRAGLSPEAVEEAERIVDAACLDLHDRLRHLGGW